MQRRKNLQELAIELDRQRATKRDYVADTRATRVLLKEREGSDIPVPVFEVREQGEFPMRDHFHTQLATAMKIPRPYYEKMRAEAPALLAGNVNHWLQESPLRRMVRTLEGDARALMSDSYRPLDNDELAEAIFPALGEAKVEIVSAEITERRMYVQATTERLRADVKRGDTVQAGIIISNSEIGAGSLRVETMLYRLICLNGMISGLALRKKHVGRKAEIIEGASEFYRDDTRKADDHAFFLKVRDTVAGVLSEENFNQHVEKLRGAAERLVTGNPAEAVEVLARQLELRDTEKGSVLSNLIKGADLSAWGMANAVTAVAHDVTDYDRGVELERAGAQIIELAPTDWREIAEAA